MNLKTTETTPSAEIPRESGGCCGGKGRGAPAAEPGRGNKPSGAHHDAKLDCCCGKQR